MTAAPRPAAPLPAADDGVVAPPTGPAAPSGSHVAAARTKPADEDDATGGIGETVRTVIYAVVIALMIRTCFYEPFTIPTPSMVPNLLVGDYIFVSKLAYGYSSRSLGIPFLEFDGRILWTAPRRGDVIVFQSPSDPGIDYVKRLIGLPGDRVQMIGGVLHINGTPVRRERIADFPLPISETQVRYVPRYIETLPEGRRYEILEAQEDSAPHDSTREFLVPAGQYFFMGDNRDNSEDSRSSLGMLPSDHLIGSADVIFFSAATPLWRVWDWPDEMRGSRIFQAVE